MNKLDNFIVDTQAGVVTSVEHFENFNLHDMVTPVDPDKLKYLLNLTDFDKEETNFLVNGLGTVSILGMMVRRGEEIILKIFH